MKGISEGVPNIGAESINGLANFDYSKLKYVPIDFFIKMRRGKVKNRDVLLYKDGGKPGEFKPKVAMYGDDFPFDEFCINEHVYRLRTSEPFCQSFLYFYLCSDDASLEMRNRGTGVAVPGLNSTAVKSLPICLPHESLAKSFSKLVSPLVDKEIQNASEAKTSATLRDALLPKLMSGAIRVQDAENAVVAIA